MGLALKAGNRRARPSLLLRPFGRAVLEFADQDAFQPGADLIKRRGQALALVGKRARKDKAFAAQLHEILDAEIAGGRNRALFDLPPKSGGDGQAAPPESGAAADEDIAALPEPVPAQSSSP